MDATPTPRELRVAARGFKARTGVGIDAISPRVFSWLSDPLLEAIGDYMTFVEGVGL